MTNTEGRINTRHPRRTSAPAPAQVRGPVVLQAGQTVILTGPRAGTVETASPSARTINYRKAGR